MGCLINSGWSLNCGNNLPSGINRVFVLPFSHVSTITKDTNNMVTLISTVANEKYYEVVLTRQNAEYIEKQILDDKTGSIWWDGTLKLDLIKNDYFLRQYYLQLLNDTYSFILMDNSSRYWLLGATHGCKLVDSEVNLGKKYLDFNGNKMVFKSKEKLPMYQILPTAFSLSTTFNNNNGSIVDTPIGQG